jgi:hypothetical protein
MGAKQSKPKEEDDQKLKLPNILDHIATKYITTSNFKDLENLHDVNYCNKLVILTSKVIKNNLHLLDIDYQEQHMEYGAEVNKMTKDRIIYLNKEGIDDIDVQSDLKKKRMCVGIARFYVRIAHIFAAISKTVNPSYSYTDSTGESHSISLMEKANLPNSVNANFSKYNLCSRRIEALKLRQNNENGVIIKVKNCEMNRKGMRGGDPVINDAGMKPNIGHGDMVHYPENTPPQNNEGEEYNTEVPVVESDEDDYNNQTRNNTLEETTEQLEEENAREEETGTQELVYEDMNMADEPGIPELETLYYDVYDYNAKEYNSMSPEATKQYNEDLKIFYETFTGNKFKDAENITKFSDIQLVDFHNQDLCTDDNSPWNTPYKGTLKDKLFKKYASHLAEMVEKTHKKEKELLGILEEIFVYWIEPEKNRKYLTINPGLSYEKLDKITKKTRNIILELYVECEKDFQEGLGIFEAIIKKNMFKTKQRQINNLNLQVNN